MSQVLIIDDDLALQVVLREHCEMLGHQAEAVGTLRDARLLLERHPPDLIFLDVRLPDGNGLEILREFRTLESAPEVIMITGQGDANGAELAIKNGVWDYLEKPLFFQDIILHIRQALEYHQKKLSRSGSTNLKRESIIGKSLDLQACLDQIARYATTDSGILLTGETGTGKQLFAHAIHKNSLRSQKPFITVDCASLPNEIAESLLFGHAKGSFTGASAELHGLIEQAHEGTLFLDEVGELSLELQKNFLRVLQEKKFRPVGKGKEINSDFRLIAATNRDLSKMVEKGQFRADLYFRLNTMTIHLPPLRDRQGDVTELAMHFLFQLSRKLDLPIKGVIPETLDTLESYHWPGNIRELRNTIEKALLADPQDPLLYPVHLPPEIRLSRIKSNTHRTNQAKIAKQQTNAALPFNTSLPIMPFKEYRQLLLSDIEQNYFKQLLLQCNNDIQEACIQSKLSRSRLYELLKKYRLP